MAIRGMIPSDWNTVSATTKEELLFLGQHFLSVLIDHWKLEYRKEQQAFNARKIKLAGAAGRQNTRLLQAQRESPQRLNLIEQRVTYLSAIIELAHRKPPLPLYRPEGWITAPSEVMVYLGGTGIVTRGLAVVDERVGAHQICVDTDGLRRSFMLQRPNVVGLKEYEYLRRYPKFLSVWSRAAYPANDVNQWVNPDDLKDAILRGPNI